MTFSPRLHETCVGARTTPGNPCRCCCASCVDECCPLHDPEHSHCLQPKRYWWYERDSWDWQNWWRWIFFASDEFCNRTVVLRLWKPFVFVRNRHLRSESCEECLSFVLPPLEGIPEGH